MVLADAGDVAGSSLPGAHTLSALGEDAVLARILPRLRPAVAALIGPGDDGAVVAASGGRFVVSTDTMVHGPDFRLAWHTPRELGWKAADTNLTDIAALGARPTAIPGGRAPDGDDGSDTRSVRHRCGGAERDCRGHSGVSRCVGSGGGGGGARPHFVAGVDHCGDGVWGSCGGTGAPLGGSGRCHRWSRGAAGCGSSGAGVAF